MRSADKYAKALAIAANRVGYVSEETVASTFCKFEAEIYREAAGICRERAEVSEELALRAREVSENMDDAIHSFNARAERECATAIESRAKELENQEPS